MTNNEIYKAKERLQDKIMDEVEKILKENGIQLTDRGRQTLYDALYPMVSI